MSQLDFPAIRSRIPIGRVLDQLGWQAATRSGPQWRGTCPICSTGEANTDQRCFSVHANRHLFRCFACGRAGNQLDLWAHIRGLSLYAATLDLCRHLDVEPIKLANPQPPNRH